jgi:hypothetical protein
MPTGISQSVVNPASLVPRSAPETAQQDRRDPAAAQAVGAENARPAAAAGPSDQLLRAPEPRAETQDVENQMPASAGTAAAQGREPLAQSAEAQADGNAPSDGLGGILDVTA